MARRKSKAKKPVQEGHQLISIPMYVSDMLKFDKDILFPDTPQSMIEDVLPKFHAFNEEKASHIIEDQYSQSSTQLGISGIEVSSMQFGEDPALLLRVSSYQSNLVDGFFLAADEQDQHYFKKQDKICTDTCFFILYPKIFNSLLKDKRAAFWHIFVYLDPSKDARMMAKIARYFMQKIVKTPIRNVKGERFLSELQKYKDFKHVEINLTTYTDGDDQEPDYITHYQPKIKIRKTKTIKLDDMSANDALAALNDKQTNCDYSSRTLKFETADQRVYSATQVWRKKMTESFEDSFNYTIEVPQYLVDSKKIFEPDFIKEKVTGLFTRYLIPDDYGDTY